MPAISDIAICIGKRDYSESSQIVTLFGREHGKISAIAKGAKRSKSKFGGGIDLLTVGNVMFVSAKGDSTLSTLTEFDLTEPFTQLRTNLLGINAAQYMASLTAEFTEEFDPHPELYDAFVQSLNDLALSNIVLNTLVQFELTLLEQVGLEPNWHHCCLCNCQLQSNSRTYFSSREGGLVCRDCEPAIVEKKLISNEILELLKNKNTISNAQASLVFRLHQMLSYHQRETMGKETAIMKFVNTLLSKQI